MRRVARMNNATRHEGRDVGFMIYVLDRTVKDVHL